MDDFERAEAINDLYRTALFNRLYNATQLRRFRRCAAIADVLIAVGSSTAIAALTLWQQHDGKIIWQGVGGGAALVGILRPAFRLGDQVQRYGELVTGYTALSFDCENLVRRMKIDDGISDDAWNQYEALIKRMQALGIKDDSVVSKRTLDAYDAEVNRRIPMRTLWWPKEKK
jgi:hypothetical protein